MSSVRQSNRLIKEKSPYLLQHAFNPVDWYPWGQEAFDKARRDHKPIFLSIGYSTCHWCHVMEKESFENPLVAEFLNAHFVSVKVDREERPDLDLVYMRAVMAMTGSGGWPLSVFLTPDLKPFFGGTYFPSEDHWGKPSFYTLLENIREKWGSDKNALSEMGQRVREALTEKKTQNEEEKRILDFGTLRKAYEELQARFDPEFGGFGPAPKFPQAHVLSFILRYWNRTRDPQAIPMVQKTLACMRSGGICDHLGGGFHRYSTDRQWHVPHFEKMLYDQAQISRACLFAYQATREEFYAATAKDIFRYVMRDMTHEDGGFFSAEDADSIEDADHSEKKSEGAFYVWTEDEVRDLLDEKDFQWVKACCGLRAEGNVEASPHGELDRRNILSIRQDAEALAKNAGAAPEEIQTRLSEAFKVLLQARNSRTRPPLDDKILTDWNGLMISSFAIASMVLSDSGYRLVAQRAADFVLKNMKAPDGRLFHRYRDGEAAIEGFLNDYAFFAQGLLDLYEADFQIRYLEEAVAATEQMIRIFWDEKDGGFFLARRDAEESVRGFKEVYDSAIPSGNSVAASVLLRIARMTGNSQYEKMARGVLEAFSREISEFPSGYAEMLHALDFFIGPSREIVLACHRSDPGFKEMLHQIHGLYFPNKILLFHSSEPDEGRIVERIAPFTKAQTAVGGKATVYVCEGHSCKIPATSIEILKKALGAPS